MKEREEMLAPQLRDQLASHLKALWSNTQYGFTYTVISIPFPLEYKFQHYVMGLHYLSAFLPPPNAKALPSPCISSTSFLTGYYL